MQLQSVADQILYSTFRVDAYRHDELMGFGTAFYFNFDPIECSEETAFLVTNKHVIEGADMVQLRLHARDAAGAFIQKGCLQTLALDGQVILHPDPHVDLCLISTRYLQEVDATENRTYAISLGEEQIPSEEKWLDFDSVEDVWMIGCPNGIFDPINNLPIVRRGITASNPRLPYKGTQEFVVDMACFPGSSGSPIFRAPSLTRFDRERGHPMLKPEGGIYLLGILYAGPLITNEGQIVMSNRFSIEVASTMHLGYAIRSNRLLDFRPIISEQARQPAVS